MMKIKGILGLALCVCVVLTLGTVAFSADVTLEDGDADGLLEIGTAQELYAFAALAAEDPLAKGELTADILLNDQVVSPYGELAGEGYAVWTPIGGGEAFLGVFDGNGHTVSGLYFEDALADGVGLFGKVGQGAQVRDLGLVDTYIRGGSDVGGLAGSSEGDILNCYVIGNISGSDRVGGLVGSNSGSITDCYSYGWISATGDVGGVAGSDGGTVINCYYLESDDLDSGIGGVDTDVEGCTAGMDRPDFNSGKVAYLLGDAYGQDVDNNQDSQDETPVLGGAKVYCGYPTCVGIDETVYSNTPASEVEVTHDYVRIRDEDSHAALCAVCGKIVNDRPHTFRGTDNGDGTHTMFCYASSCGWEGETQAHGDDGNGFCPECDAALEAELVDGVYQIGNAGQLYWFAQLVGYGQTDACAVLTADIVDNGDLTLDPDQLRQWLPIGSFEPFTGTLDGQGHQVSGLYCDGALGGIALVRQNRGTVRGVGVVDVLFNSTMDGAQLGGVVACNTGTVENCWSDGIISASGAGVQVGGVVGCQDGGILKGCFSLAQVSGDGGVVGSVIGCVAGEAQVERCYGAAGIDPVGQGEAEGVAALEETAFSSGEVAWLLGSPFGQEIGVEDRPVWGGVTVYQATDCLGQILYSNVEGEGQHLYGDDGLCGVCGGEEMTVPVLTLRYPSLSFEGEILYNIYYTAQDLEDVIQMGLVTFDTALGGTVDDAVAVFPGFETDGTVWKVATGGISTKELGDVLYFSVYAQLRDGSYVYSSVKSYSAREYARTILDRDTSSDAMKSLVVAMLQYGAQAQLYFGYETDTLMDAELTQEEKTLVAAYDEAMMEAVPEVDAVKAAGFVYEPGGFLSARPTVSFDGAFAINYYFTAAQQPEDGMRLYYWDLASYDSAQVLTVENASGMVEMDATGEEGQYWGQVAGIAAKQIDEAVFVVGVYEYDGVSYCTGVRCYSVGEYCRTVAGRDDSDQQSLAVATAVYGYHAKAYFASI